MSVCGIKCSGIFAVLREAVNEAFLRMVGIMCQHGAADNILALSAVILKLTAYKATFILGAVTVSFGKLRILLRGFRCVCRMLEAGAEVIKGRGLVRPLLREAAVPVGNW